MHINEINCLTKFLQNNESRHQFVYYDPQIKLCSWAYKVDNCFWNSMSISKNREKRSSIIEVQITK